MDRVADPGGNRAEQVAALCLVHVTGLLDNAVWIVDLQVATHLRRSPGFHPHPPAKAGCVNVHLVQRTVPGVHRQTGLLPHLTGESVEHRGVLWIDDPAGRRPVERAVDPSIGDKQQRTGSLNECTADEPFTHGSSLTHPNFRSSPCTREQALSGPVGTYSCRVTGPLSALPSRAARALAFVAILVGGFAGGLIGFALIDVQCNGSCGTPRALGAAIGAVVAAVGTAVVSVLVLRAMGEWREIQDRQS